MNKLTLNNHRGKMAQGPQKDFVAICGPFGLEAQGGCRRRGKPLLGGLFGRKNC